MVISIGDSAVCTLYVNIWFVKNVLHICTHTATDLGPISIYDKLRRLPLDTEQHSERNATHSRGEMLNIEGIKQPEPSNVCVGINVVSNVT
jgi:hypothetical protein